MSVAKDVVPRKSLKERLFGNPVVLKELRGRMRGARAFIVLTVYLGLMSGFSTLIYVLFQQNVAEGNTAQAGLIGRTLFYSIAGIELFLVTFIAPAFAASAVSGEREHQTYDLLRTTLLPARALVVGKLVSTLSYILLLLLVAVPLQSIAFLFGGVTETEIILDFVILIMTALLLGTVGVFFSAVSGRTLSASVMSYAFSLFTVLVLPVVLLVVGPFFNSIVQSFSNSPFLESALYYVVGLLIATNPLATLIVTMYLVINGYGAGLFTLPLLSGGDLTLVSPWIPFSILAAITAVILVIMAVRRVDQIEEV